MAAVLSGATQSVAFLLEHLDADPTIPERDGYTPMHGAGFQGRADIAQLLIDRHLQHHDCPVDAPHTGDYVTPLWRTTWGSEKRHVETGIVMIEGGANPNYRVPDEHSQKAGSAATPLQSAVVRANLRSVQMLCAHGGNANLQNRDGATSLHLSIGLLQRGDRSQEGIVKCLLENCEANPNIKDHSGKSCYMLMAEDEGLLPDFLKELLIDSARIQPSDPKDVQERDDKQQKKKKKKKKKKKRKKKEGIDTVEL